MVARPPVAFVVDRMTVDDLEAVHVIEKESFSTPWPAHAYRQELETNRLAHYMVARWGDRIVGFAGMWLMVDEAHVTTFAVSGEWRRHGIGERLLLALLDLSRARGAHEATLEVRPSNVAARRLYEKYGFKLVGVRPRYYSDNNEDALIMTTEDLDGPSMRGRIASLREAVAKRPDMLVGDDGRPMVRTEAEASVGASTAPGEGRESESVAAAEPAESAAESGAGPEPAAESAEPAKRVIRPSSVTRKQL